MDPVDRLTEEHQLIRSFLENLTLALDRLEQGKLPPGDFFNKAVEFARVFTDKYHHFKEEYVMFGMLAQKKSGDIDPQIESLRHQHERGRNLVAEMQSCIKGYNEGDTIRTSDLIQSLGAYVSLLRHHIHREDHLFYPLARKEFTGEEMNQLGVEFEKIAKDYEGTFKACEGLISDMGRIIAD